MKKVLLLLLSLLGGFTGAHAFQAEIPGEVRSLPFAVVKIHWAVDQPMPDPFDPVATQDSNADVTPADVLWGERPRSGVRSRSTSMPAQQPLSSENGVVRKPSGFPNTSSAVPQQGDEKDATVPGHSFLYAITLRNLASQTIQTVYWDYIFADPDTKAEVSRLKFMSNVKINPGKSKQVDVLSGTPPTPGVHIKQLRKRHPLKLNESVAVIRIDYADGSIWRPK